eukprot:g672.t1
MNKQFAEVAARYVKAAPNLTHKQNVTRLYRHSLKILASWAIDHEIIAQEAEKIRSQFDANKGLEPESGASKRLIREAREKLAEFTHPDMYVIPYMPGGSKFMRNAPPPLKVVFPHGVPEGISKQVTPQHPDGILESIRPGNGPVLVDMMQKKLIEHAKPEGH